jgi:hypothetical protein
LIGDFYDARYSEDISDEDSENSQELLESILDLEFVKSFQ